MQSENMRCKNQNLGQKTELQKVHLYHPGPLACHSERGGESRRLHFDFAL
jgi:hypothetical protein